MHIKPIHTPEDHAAALAKIESLWNAAPGTPAGDALEVLGTLVDSYEREHTPILPPDAVEAIKFRLEQEGKTRKDLEPILGTRARVFEVLNYKRSLSLTMIRALHRELRIPLAVLVPERIAAPAAKSPKTRKRKRTSSPTTSKTSRGHNTRARAAG